MLHRSQNETVASAAEKCADLDCEAANARILPNSFLEVIFLKDIHGRFKDFGSHCISSKFLSIMTSILRLLRSSHGFLISHNQFLKGSETL